MAYREQEVPAEVDRSILIVGLYGHVYGLSRATGEIVWENGLPGGGTQEVFVAMRYGALIVSANGAQLYRLDYATGATLWQRPTTASGRASVVIEHDCVTVAKGGYIDCFDLEGALRWKQPMKGKGVGLVALGYPGNVAQADEAE